MHSTYSLKSAIYREPGEEFDYATVDAGNVDTEQKPSRVTLIATALDKLALMELDQQSEHEYKIYLLFGECLKLLTDEENTGTFLPHHITKLIHALSRLPVVEAKCSKLYEALLERARFLSGNGKNNRFGIGGSAVMLASIAKLSINLMQHKEVILRLLKAFSKYDKDKLSKLETSYLNQLWQFMIYAKIVKFDVDIVNQLLPVVHTVVETREPIVTGSPFQEEISQMIGHLLNSEATQQMEEEYQVGIYALDIAFPKTKLNVEVDGPHHYRDETLSRKDRFRDFVLRRYFDWQIVRIPYFDWKEKNKEEKIDFLLKKLADYSYLLNNTGINRQQKILQAIGKAKPAISYSSALSHLIFANTIPTEEDFKQETESVAVVNKPEKKYLKTNRFLNSIFAERIEVKDSNWKLEANAKFRLRKQTFKKGITWFKEQASANDLILSFQEDKKRPKFFKLVVAKDSLGLQRMRAKASNTEDKAEQGKKELSLAILKA
jgi:very-short-patch-repair endonuclease